MVLTDMDMGGITVAATNLCNELCNYGHKVDMLVLGESDQQAKEKFNDNVSFLELKGFARFWNLKYDFIRHEKNILKKIVLLILGVVKKIANRKSRWNQIVFWKKTVYSGYDAVIAYRQCAPCYYFVLNCVEASKKIAFVHGDLNYMGDISSWRKYMCEFDAIAYVSENIKIGFEDKYPDLKGKGIVVRNVFDKGFITSKAVEHIKFTWPENKIRIVTVSRIENETKAIYRIPQIVKLLIDKYGKCFYWCVIGDGRNLDDCNRKVKEMQLEECLIFLGKKDNPYPWIYQSDFSVLPSYTEAFPMVVCESLILGVPVIVARYPAVAEQFTIEKNGLVAEQNVESILTCIGELIENPEKLKKMRGVAREYNYDNYESIYQLVKVLDDENKKE